MSKRVAPAVPAEAAPGRPVPVVHERNAPFWTGGAVGELRVQRCTSCGRHVHPVVELCPYDHHDRLDWVVVSGRGVVRSWTESRHAWVPGLPAPYLVALVGLEEDLRACLLTNLVGIEPDEVRVGMAVQVRFEPVGEGDATVHLPLFGPPRSTSVTPVAS